MAIFLAVWKNGVPQGLRELQEREERNCKEDIKMEKNGEDSAFYLALSSAKGHLQMLSVNNMIECSLKAESCINFLSL